MPRSAPRHDRDAGGPADVLSAKAALREEVWSAMRAAKVARFPGAAGRIPNFTGAEAAAELLRSLPPWKGATTLKANPDSAQLPVRQRALEDGKTVYMAVPRLAKPEPFFALDPDHLAEPPRKAASISGATRSARRVTLDELTPVDLVVMGSVAVGEDGARLGKGGGFADLEFALASAAGLIAPGTVTVTTVHEIQVRPAGAIPLTSHDVPVDFVVTPERVIDCRERSGGSPGIGSPGIGSSAIGSPGASSPGTSSPGASSPATSSPGNGRLGIWTSPGIEWAELTDEKIAAIPLLSALRAARSSR